MPSKFVSSLLKIILIVFSKLERPVFFLTKTVDKYCMLSQFICFPTLWKRNTWYQNKQQSVTKGLDLLWLLSQQGMLLPLLNLRVEETMTWLRPLYITFIIYTVTYKFLNRIVWKVMDQIISSLGIQGTLRIHVTLGLITDSVLKWITVVHGFLRSEWNCFW